MSGQESGSIKQNLNRMSESELQDLVHRDFNEIWVKHDKAVQNGVAAAPVEIKSFSVVKESDAIRVAPTNSQFSFKHQSEFHAIYDKFPANTRYVIDFSRVKYVDSAALGMLLLLREHNGADSSLITLVNCNDTIKQTLKLAHFDRMFAFGE